MQQKSETKALVKRIKLEPPFNAGDCGYYALFTGILYLALVSQNEDNLSKTLDESRALSDILEAMDNHFTLAGSNVECLRKMIAAMNSEDWDKLSYQELLMNFSNAMRYVLAHCSWSGEFFKAVIREGAWSFDYSGWNKLPSFKRLENRIFDRMSEMVDGYTVDVEKAGEVRFNATLEVCKNLRDDLLEQLAREVIQHHYGPNSQKAWISREFLEFLCHQFFASSTLLFNEQGVEITSKGVSDSHWYIDLPDDQAASTLIEAANKGYMKNLRIVERFIIRDNAPLTLEGKQNILQDLLTVRRNTIEEFKTIMGTIQSQRKPLSDDVTALAFFEIHLPDEQTITHAFLPLLAKNDKWMTQYSRLVILSKTAMQNESKITQLKQEIAAMKEMQTSNSVVAGSGKIAAIQGLFANAPVNSDTPQGSIHRPGSL